MLQHTRGQKRRFICGAMLLIAFFIFGGLSPVEAAQERTADIVKEAEKEGKVVFLHSFPMTDVEIIADRFRKKYPFIKLEFVHQHNAQILNRVMAEQKAKKNTIDVLHSKGDVIYMMQKRGLLAKYLSPEREFYVERFKDREGYWTDAQLTVLTLAYNTRMVPRAEIPATYRDLLKPQWVGKIGINPLQYTWLEVVMQIMGKEAGLKYLESLARQSPMVRKGGPLNIILMAAGEISLAVPINSNNVESAKAKGAPVDWAKIKPYYGDLHPISLAANAPHPNAGKLLIDYFLSREGQELVVDLGKVSSRTGVKSKTVRSDEIIPLDPALGEKTDYYFKLLRQIFGGKI